MTPPKEELFILEKAVLGITRTVVNILNTFDESISAS
jgi:hypothetical protein